MAYFTVNPYKDDGIFNEAYLDSLDAEEETERLRHIRFEKPITAKVDGMKKKGIVTKPEA